MPHRRSRVRARRRTAARAVRSIRLFGPVSAASPRQTPRANARGCDPVAMVRVHVHRDLEHLSGQAWLRRFDFGGGVGHEVLWMGAEGGLSGSYGIAAINLNFSNAGRFC